MESTTRYKMYKAGKKWVVASLVAMSVGSGVVTTASTLVNADTVSSDSYNRSGVDAQLSRLNDTIRGVQETNRQLYNLEGLKILDAAVIRATNFVHGSANMHTSTAIEMNQQLLEDAIERADNVPLSAVQTANNKLFQLIDIANVYNPEYNSVENVSRFKDEVGVAKTFANKPLHEKTEQTINAVYNRLSNVMTELRNEATSPAASLKLHTQTFLDAIHEAQSRDLASYPQVNKAEYARILKAAVDFVHEPVESHTIAQIGLKNTQFNGEIDAVLHDENRVGALHEVVTKYQKEDLSKYTTDSQHNFRLVLNQANTYLNSKTVQHTSDTSQRLINDLGDRYAALTDAPKQVTANKQHLEYQVKLAQSYTRALYTKASYDNMANVLAKAVVVEKNGGATQKQVDTATNDLIQALHGVKRVANTTVNKAHMQSEIRLAQSYTRALYTKDSYNHMANVLAKAVAVNANKNATQKDVDSVTNQLISALGNVKRVASTKANKTHMLSEIRLAQSYTRALYTKDSYNHMANVLAKAVAVNANKNATQKDVDSVTNQLISALGNVKRVASTKANKTHMLSEIRLAQSYTRALYTKASYDHMANVLAKAVDVYHNRNATQKDVNIATNQLISALGNVKRVASTKANKTHMLSEIRLAQSYTRALYTKVSYNHMANVLAKAVDVYHNQNATQKDVDGITNQLITALGGVKRVASVDKTHMLKEIRFAQGLNRNLYRTYSSANLDKVLAKTVDVYHDQNATRYMVDLNTNKLIDALSKMDFAYNVHRDNLYSAQYLSGARDATYYINGKQYNYHINNASWTHSNGRTNFVAAGCTENALANAMKVAGLVQNGTKVTDLAAKFWTLQTGGLGVNQGVTRYNQQSLATVGDYAPISMPLANDIIKRGASALNLFEGQQNFTMVGSTYYGYGLGVAKGQKVAAQIEAWRKQGYFISAMVRAAGTNASADHAVTVATLAPNFAYGKSINFIDSYHGGAGLVQGLNNTQKLQYVYKLMAYKATDFNGNQIRSAY